MHTNLGPCENIVVCLLAEWRRDEKMEGGIKEKTWATHFAKS